MQYYPQVLACAAYPGGSAACGMMAGGMTTYGITAYGITAYGITRNGSLEGMVTIVYPGGIRDTFTVIKGKIHGTYTREMHGGATYTALYDNGIMQKNMLLAGSSKQKIPPDEKAADEMDSRFVCSACLVNISKVTLKCQHCCLCIECSKKVNKCPLCRVSAEVLSMHY